MSELLEEYSKLKGFVDKLKEGVSLDTNEVISSNSKVFSLLQQEIAKGSKEAKDILKEYLVILFALSKKGQEEKTEAQNDLMEKMQEIIKNKG